MPQTKPSNSIPNTAISTSISQAISGSKTFTNSIFVSNSSTNPATLTWANTAGTQNEIAHEGNIIEILCKAISNASDEAIYKLLFELELRKVEAEVKNEYLTLLKLSNYNYKVALAELIKTERDKDLMKLLLESDKDKK